MLWVISFITFAALAYTLMVRKKKEEIPIEFPRSWRTILETKVLFYHHLSPENKLRFEHDVSRFLRNVPITGIRTPVDITDKLLVASSAVIPVFGFPQWDYTFLDEVLLYPGSFDRNYSINSREEVITGMVGSGGVMEGKMILSKPALLRGFENESDKQNVGIHEFIHLLDKEDGSIDGIPATLADKQYSLPWLRLVREKIAAIHLGDKDINPYGATHEREFLAVIGEYFFERPHQLQQKHPELYNLLVRVFNQDTASAYNVNRKSKKEIQRNDPCPCGSGLKFKKCCMDRR